MLVLTVKLLGELDLLEAQLEYHLSAGVDHVVVGRLESSSDGVREKLDRFAATDVTVESLVEPRSSARDHLRRVAIERGAEWIIESDADEFWWPRGPSLSQVLEPIPPRYTTVQALVRVFPPRPGNGSFDERMTVRPSLLLADTRPEPLAWALRPVHRVVGQTIVDASEGRFVPLRAWYPIEVFRFPLRSSEQAAAAATRGESRSTLEAAFHAGERESTLRRYSDLVVDDEQARKRLAEGSLVEDPRLRECLHALRSGRGMTTLMTPTIVDEASHAVECAAVGEVDLVGLDRHIRELEDRISNLEQRFWPRVVRRLSRLTRRSGA